MNDKLIIKIMVVAVAWVAVLSVFNVAFGQQFNKVMGINEDELIVTNFKGESKIIHIDDFMTRAASDELWREFNHHWDTFPVEAIHD